jgi:hypothetical protein
VARRRRKDAATISLLPILSIQKCTMGIMVILICAQTLISLGQTADQYLEIGGVQQDREAVFVECQKNGVLIHPAKREVSLADLKGNGPSPFHDLLDDLKINKERKYLVLLVRPDGIESYERCYAKVRERRLDVGKDALLEGGDLILTKEGKPVVTLKKGGR